MNTQNFPNVDLPEIRLDALAYDVITDILWDAELSKDRKPDLTFCAICLYLDRPKRRMWSPIVDKIMENCKSLKLPPLIEHRLMAIAVGNRILDCHKDSGYGSFLKWHKKTKTRVLALLDRIDLRRLKH